MPPFSPTGTVEAVVPPVGLDRELVTFTHAGGHGAYGALPNSIQLLWLVIPDQPSAQTQGGSIRPVEATVPVPGLVIAVPLWYEEASAEQSALAQYTAPGTDKSAGKGTASKVFARKLYDVDVPHARAPFAVPQEDEPSAGPPAS